jgi:hypothetical protein
VQSWLKNNIARLLNIKNLDKIVLNLTFFTISKVF